MEPINSNSFAFKLLTRLENTIFLNHGNEKNDLVESRKGSKEEMDRKEGLYF